MTVKIGLILVFATLLSCNSGQSTASTFDKKTEGDILKDKEFAQIDNKIDSLGTIISTIDFKIKATGEDLKIFDDGIIPWISLDNPDKEIGKLIDADKIILQQTLVTVIIDYPLTYPATFELSTKSEGFSRKQLIKEISKKYHEIYKLEEASAKTKTLPMDKRKGLINRNQTDGKFGVWGHDLSDLDLSTIEVHRNSNGKIYLTLGVES